MSFRKDFEDVQVIRDTCANPFAAYEPHDGQRKFHQSTGHEKWLITCNQFGKTTAGCMEVLKHITGIDPLTHEKTPGWRADQRWRACGDSFSHGIEDVILPEFRRWLHASQYNWEPLKHRLTVRGPRGTGIVQFRTYDQDLRKHTGEKLDGVWFDEEPPRDVYSENSKRIMRRKGYIIGTMTPDAGITWTYEDIFMQAQEEGSTIEVFQGDISKNDYLELSEIKHQLSKLAPEEIEAAAFGRYAALTGLVYSEFDPDVHVVEPFIIPADWCIAVGIDHGLNNPTAAEFVAISKDGAAYACMEYVATERTAYQNACYIKEITARLFPRNRFLFYAIDASTKSREGTSLTTTVHSEYNRAGVYCKTRHASVESGVNLVKELMRIKVSPDGHKYSRFYMFRPTDKFHGVPILMREMRQYAWEAISGRRAVDPPERPRRYASHCLDGLRYCLQERPTWITLDNSAYTDSMFQASSKRLGY